MEFLSPSFKGYLLLPVCACLIISAFSPGLLASDPALKEQAAEAVQAAQDARAEAEDKAEAYEQASSKVKAFEFQASTAKSPEAKKSANKALKTAKKEVAATQRDMIEAQQGAASTAKKAKKYKNALYDRMDAFVKDLTHEFMLIDHLLDKFGFPNTQHLQQSIHCISVTSTHLKTLKQNPKDPEAIMEMKRGRCRVELDTLSTKCRGPAAVAAAYTPVGYGVANLCKRVDIVRSQADQAYLAFKMVAEQEKK